MNKDALLATLIGFAVGLIITGVLVLGPTIGKSLPAFTFKLPSFSLSFLKPRPAQTPTPTPPAISESLTIDSPLPDTIEETDETLVSGSTTAGATVVMQGLIDDAVVAAGTDGKFAGKLTLSEGKNDLVVTSYRDEEQTTKTLTVFYTPEEF